MSCAMINSDLNGFMELYMTEREIAGQTTAIKTVIKTSS